MFNPEVIEKIKSYVYLYSDPDTEEIFYIGKGKGNRCFSHLHEELELDLESNKLQKIQQLKEQNKQPLIELLRYGLTDNEASLVEASLIDFNGLENLTNKVRGLHSNSFGRLLVDDITLKYTAEEVEVNDDIISITINQLYHSKISDEELYESTRGVWKVGERREKAEYAFAVFQGVVREVYRIHTWYKAGTQLYMFREINQDKYPERWEFKGEIAEGKIREKYLRKSIRSYLSRGSQNPIKYINC